MAQLRFKLIFFIQVQAIILLATATDCTATPEINKAGFLSPVYSYPMFTECVPSCPQSGTGVHVPKRPGSVVLMRVFKGRVPGNEGRKVILYWRLFDIDLISMQRAEVAIGREFASNQAFQGLNGSSDSVTEAARGASSPWFEKKS